ncbi:hypothetical protein OLP55_02290, partial [Campylobacter jejuni]|nr:hypothetical protein [Campylobacter jejuni]
MKKKLAIQLFGLVRTYADTFDTFFNNVIIPNSVDYDIDIFIHSWDIFSAVGAANGLKNSRHYFYPTMTNKKLCDYDIKDIKNKYKPKKIKIESLKKLEWGIYRSLSGVNKLREEYEKEHNINYDCILCTRMDLFFFNELKLDNYIINAYKHLELRNLGLPNKYIFTVCNEFGSFDVRDPRYPAGSDLLWFGNVALKNPPFCIHNENPNIVPILIKYGLNSDFIIFREKKDCNNLYLCHDKKDFYFKYFTAKSRIQNQLSYKLGQTLIINSKSIFGILCMPIYIISTIINHNQEQKIYKAKIKKIHHLKLPPLENYPD